MNNPAIFLTDYASYNNGTQFQFGHWVNLTDFSDASELMEYIKDHFNEADQVSPLDSPREEIMITDFEGFPESLYGEAMSEQDFEKIYKLIDFMQAEGLDNLDNEGDNLLGLWNEYASETAPDDQIFYFDDEFFNTFLSHDPAEAFRLGCFSDINWSDEYIKFNGYGNLESLSDPSQYIDETALINWILEAKI